MLPYRLRHQQGATLIVLVLLTMLLLLAVLFVTMNLTMSARRTTTDQRQLVPAQFAAESGMATAQAQLRAFREIVPLMDADTPRTDEVLYQNRNNIAAVSPAHQRGINMRYNDVMTQLRQLCGAQTVQNLDTPTPPLADRTYRGVTVKQVTTVCTFPTTARALSGNQLNIIRSVMLSVNSSTTAKPLVDKFNSYGLASDADREKFVQAAFGNTVTNPVAGGATVDLSGGIRPVALVRGAVSGGDPTTSVSQTRYPYYLLFELADIDSQGNNGDAARRQVMTNTNSMYALRLDFGFYGVKGTPPKSVISFSNFAMFVNDASTGAPLGRDTFVRGRMHTNTYWQTRVYPSRDTQPQGTGFLVDGKITSAGCGRLTTDGTKCAETPRARIYNADTKNAVFNPTNQGSANGYNYIGASANTMIRVKQGQEFNFQSDPIPLPPNANDQISASKEGGIYIPASVSQMDLSVTVANGTESQNISYKTANSTCYLRVTPKVTVNSTGAEERVEYIYIWNGTSWQSAQRSTSATCGFTPVSGTVTETYNGNLYVEGTVDSLTRKRLNTGTQSYAVANGMKTTFTATGNIKVSETIDYRDRTTSTSALGLYSSGTIDANRDGQPDGGGIMFAQNAANDIKLDAFIMAPRGAFYLENLNNINSDKGSMSQFGGQILRGGGGGMASGSSYGYTTREYLYDDRGAVPRGFPTYTEEVVEGDPVPDGNPYLIYLKSGFLLSGALNVPNDGFENNGEIRQVAVQ